MKRRVISLIAIFALAGCAGISRAREFNDVDPVPFQSGESNWRIFDKPAESRLMITPSLGQSIRIGAAKGATAGMMSDAEPQAIIQKAVEDWLAKSGRSCQVISGEDILDPQWEFKYRCA